MPVDRPPGTSRHAVNARVPGEPYRAAGTAGSARKASSSARAGRDHRAAATPSALGGAGLEAQLHAAMLLRKSDGPEGREPLLAAVQADRVRAVFKGATRSTLRALASMVAVIDGPGAAIGRALLFRAVAARQRRLLHGDEHALAALAAFAQRVRGMSGAALLTCATVLDLDSTKNTSALDPQALWQTQGTVRDVRAPDTNADNDGLFQRFTGACGPATLQMMLAEADPIFAFSLHDLGLHSDSSDDGLARQQRQLLERFGGGKALGRVESYLRSRVRNGLGQLVAMGTISSKQRSAGESYLLSGPNGPQLGAAGREALERMRQRYGFPSEEEVQRLRARVLPRSDDGITTDSLLDAINAGRGRFHQAIGVRYRAKEVARGQAWRALGDVERALRRGDDVPFGCSDPGHWMLLSAVKGRAPRRSFLVSDPDGGRTAWVGEGDLARGRFLIDKLHLARPGQVPWIDCFLLPEPR